MSPQPFPYRARQSGLSLVEMMVAMTIGLFVAGMVATVFLSARQSARYQEATGRLQENARFALDLMSHAVRNAGYVACGSATKYANVVNNASTTWWLDLSAPLIGYEGDEDTFPSHLSAAADSTDALVTVGVDTSKETAATSHNPNSAQIGTTQHSIKPGAILLISDCSRATVFQMSGPTNNNNNATNIVHNTGASIEPGNCYKELGASCGSGAENYTYEPGSTITPLYSQSFYIADSASGNARSLWSVALDSLQGEVSTTELIEGVENMQLEYGEDTDGDGIPNRYTTADEIAAWDDVITVRISLLMSTVEDGLTSTAQTYQYNGESITASDRRIRRSYSSVVTLRNRSK